MDFPVRLSLTQRCSCVWNDLDASVGARVGQLDSVIYDVGLRDVPRSPDDWAASSSFRHALLHLRLRREAVAVAEDGGDGERPAGLQEGDLAVVIRERALRFGRVPT